MVGRSSSHSAFRALSVTCSSCRSSRSLASKPSLVAYFTSTAASHRQPKSKRSAKPAWPAPGSVAPTYGSHHSRESFTSPVQRRGGFIAGGGGGFKSRPVAPPDFTAPKPYALDHVVHRLKQRLDLIDPARHGQTKDASAFATRAITYGVKGEAVRQLATAGGQDDFAAVMQLLAKWIPLARRQVDEALQAARSDVASDTWNLQELRSTSGDPDENAFKRMITGAFVDSMVTQIEAQGSKAALATALHLRQLRSTLDLRNPALDYPLARTLTRNIHLHVGPTNSGKTYGALLALCKARTGVFAGPLRLLAHEVWERINSGSVSSAIAPRACNLLTGEEQRNIDGAGLTACTVEMVNVERPYDVGVVDEIQMIADSDRGYAWTAAVLGTPAKELHLCGEASVVPLIRRMAQQCGDVLHVHHYQRLTPLRVEEQSLEGDLNKITKGDCVVSFSRNGIFALKSKIETLTGLRCAVAYGSLPPETKSEQARLFNDPESDVDVIVASDAIGMGLNLKIKRVVFETLHKWNGKDTVTLSASQIKQIAGRAGRYGTGASGVAADANSGSVTTLDALDLPILCDALEAPLLPIEKAAIQPSSEALAQLATLLTPAHTSRVLDDGPLPVAVAELRPGAVEEQAASAEGTVPTPPPSLSLSALLSAVESLSRVDVQSYFLSGFRTAHELSPVVEAAARDAHLPMRDRERFSNAPASTRDVKVMAVLSNCVRLYARGALISFEDAQQDLDMLEALEGVEEIKQAAEKKMQQALAKAASTGGTSTINAAARSAATYVEQGVLDINVLVTLESLHRSLTLYLWLAFRFPLAFCYHKQVTQIKLRTEEAIDFGLETIRSNRARRLMEMERRRALGQDGNFTPKSNRERNWAATGAPKGSFKTDVRGPSESSRGVVDRWA